MSSPWDPAISQAMQRHGGSNRSPRVAPPKAASDVPVEGLPAPDTPEDLRARGESQATAGAMPSGTCLK